MNTHALQAAFLGVPATNLYAQSGALHRVQARLERLRQGRLDATLKAYRHCTRNVRKRVLCSCVCADDKGAGAAFPPL
jgi:hypothetical protein